MVIEASDLKAEIGGLHLTFIGFITLWYFQQEFGSSGLSVADVAGWILVLGGGFVTLIAYFGD